MALTVISIINKNEFWDSLIWYHRISSRSQWTWNQIFIRGEQTKNGLSILANTEKQDYSLSSVEATTTRISGVVNSKTSDCLQLKEQFRKVKWTGECFLSSKEVFIFDKLRTFSVRIKNIVVFPDRHFFLTARTKHMRDCVRGCSSGVSGKLPCAKQRPALNGKETRSWQWARVEGLFSEHQ